MGNCLFAVQTSYSWGLRLCTSRGAPAHLTGARLHACREAGWAGVAVAPGQPSQAALARHFAKDVTLFDGPVAVRTIHTLYYPSAVQLLSTQLAATLIGGPLVAVVEGPQVRAGPQPAAAGSRNGEAQSVLSSSLSSCSRQLAEPLWYSSHEPHALPLPGCSSRSGTCGGRAGGPGWPSSGPARSTATCTAWQPRTTAGRP